MKKSLLVLAGSWMLFGCTVGVAHRTHDHAPVRHCRARHVLWTSYWRCTEAEMRYLECVPSIDDADLLVLIFIARQCDRPIREVVESYDPCGRDLWQVASKHGVSHGPFFTERVVRWSACPPPYGHAYGRYWNGERGSLSNEECRALVALRAGVEHYGDEPGGYFREFEQRKGRGESDPFKAAVRERGERKEEARDREEERRGDAQEAKKREMREEEKRRKAERRERKEEARDRAEERREAEQEARKREIREEEKRREAERREEKEEARRHEEHKQKDREEAKRQHEEKQRRDADEARRQADEAKRNEQDARRKDAERQKAEEARQKQEHPKGREEGGGGGEKEKGKGKKDK